MDHFSLIQIQRVYLAETLRHNKRHISGCTQKTVSLIQTNLCIAIRTKNNHKLNSLNLNQWTVTDSQWLFTDGNNYKSLTENQWNILNSLIESVKASGGSNKTSTIF